jgi:glycosyltransferase involved in cell wall biosynthesis
MNPKVSVVIPTYNRAVKIQKAIKSVLAQTFSDLEVIVVDDGSSDDTRKILQETLGGQIRYYAQATQGPSGARNKGIEEAQGEWIAFLDSDDIWEKEKLEWQLKALARFGAKCGACYTDARLMNKPEAQTAFQSAEHLYHHRETMGITSDAMEVINKQGRSFFIWVSSLLVRADAIRKAGGFDPDQRFGEDDEFLFRLAMVTKLCYVNIPLVWVDQGPGEERHVGVSADWDRIDFVLQQNQHRFEKRLRLSEGLPKKVRMGIRAELRSVHSAWANWYLENGQYGKAREAVFRAVRTDPTFNVAVKWLLTWISPQLARRTMRHRMAGGTSSAFVKRSI